ncbi:MAG: hypothetical protein J6K82_04095 [Alphaproteobacteria bacterium]|nr:hypothetical protein [Alphaproteobacteria bacterium]
MKKIDLKKEKSPVVKIEQLKDRYLFTLQCDYERFAGCKLSELKSDKYASGIKFVDGKYVMFVVKDLVAPLMYSVVKRHCENCLYCQKVAKNMGPNGGAESVAVQYEVLKQKVRSR